MWDFLMEYVMPVFLIIFLVIAVILVTGMTIYLYRRDILDQDKYIKNLETKLNIYEERYDRFVLEDNLNQ